MVKALAGRILRGPYLAALGVALTLAGCSPAPVMERMPTELGGLPSGAPADPTAHYRYPAVHDTPAPHATAPLTDEQQLELEKQLQEARKKQKSEAAGMQDTPVGADADKAAK